MTDPQRWLDDPDADSLLRDALRGAPAARSLDQVTRRRLASRVARASALPAAAAGWVFVKSAAAALGVVLGGGAIAVSTGIVDWEPPQPSHNAPLAPAPQRQRRRPAPPPMQTLPEAPLAAAEPVPTVEPEAPQLNPTPSLPVASSVASAASSAGSLSAETALLEQARRQMRSAPAAALSVAAQHASRFPRGQLTSERTLIQIEALHRLGRDAEARNLARGLLSTAHSGLYAERVHQLLGASVGQ